MMLYIQFRPNSSTFCKSVEFLISYCVLDYAYSTTLFPIYLSYFFLSYSYYVYLKRNSKYNGFHLYVAILVIYRFRLYCILGKNFHVITVCLYTVSAVVIDILSSGYQQIYYIYVNLKIRTLRQ